MKQLLSISLVILLLASSLGMTFSTHYCGGHAMKSALALSHVDMDCGMGMNHDDTITRNSIRSKACCENEYISIELDDQFNSSIDRTDVNPVFIIALAYALAPSPALENSQIVNFSDYNPPPLIADIQVAHQTFLL